MHVIYNYIARFVRFLFATIAPQLKPTTKFRRFIITQRDLIGQIETAMAASPVGRPVLWFHAASYGEYNIARPIVQHLHKSGNWHIVLTFFSPTGLGMYHTYKEEVDNVFMLPLDTPGQASRFLDAIRPQQAVFLVSEYWVNYLHELKVRHIPTYLISANITESALPLKCYGGLWRDALKAFTKLYVLNVASRNRLEKIGVTQVEVVGDPLFDNVMSRAKKEYHNEIIERFVAQGPVFIAGSIHKDKDLRVVTKLANNHPDIRFLIVPHEISEDILQHIQRRLKGESRRYSECTGETEFTHTQVLIIDFMGALTYLYRYARWAYVGGGFTPYLHSVIEATAYNIPVAFGPRLERKFVAQELVAEGIGCSIHTSRELNNWFSTLKDDEPRMHVIASRARLYMQGHQGGTDAIIQLIESHAQ
ncbi:MAG: 3-deoxy-D-manno-octulosonic acid transferase [Bacteroidaceae bacterium]|nr:3-deoxy-D-manno-octulosonic acid transferase [Bacteroidaceae bacterium]